jgi:hypothetical protein
MYPFRLLFALKSRRERRFGRAPQPAVQAHRTHLTLDLEPLEDRCLMSAGANIAPPAPVGSLSMFAWGFGPGMQIDIFEVDQTGQVFGLPVQNIFGGKGATTFINSNVAISDLTLQDQGALGLLLGANNQPYLMDLFNASDPHVFDAAVNSLLGPFAALLSPPSMGGGGNGGSGQSGSTSAIVGTFKGTVSASSWGLPGHPDTVPPYTITLTINANGSDQITISPDQAGFSTTFTGQITQNADGTLTLLGTGSTGTMVELTEAKIVNGNQLNGNLSLTSSQGYSVNFDATDQDTGAYRFLLTRQ